MPKYDGSSQMPSNEPGAEDNRLSLNPADEQWADTLDSWEDGQRYKVDLEIEQISPGEFRVISMKAEESEPAAEEEPNPSAEAEAKGAGMARQYPNPAVAGMMEQ